MAGENYPGFLPPFERFATHAIHVGQEPEQWSSLAVVPPITLTTVFEQRAPGKNEGYKYIRCGNPTRDCLEKAAAALDGAKYCLAFSSGIGAILNICHLLKTGDKIVCTVDVYGGGYSTLWLQPSLCKGSNPPVALRSSEFPCRTSLFFEACFYQCPFHSPPQWQSAASSGRVLLVWLETPTNPTLKVIDIRACADVAHRKQKEVLVAVDNTFMSPYFQVFTLAFSLGGYESLAEHPAIMTHASVPEKEREALGITDTLIRLSVGLEDEEALIEDLDQALEAAASMRTDERKRNCLSWTRREEQKQSHSSHKPCAPFPGSVSKPWAAFGEGFHASKELSTHFCSILDQEMGSLYSKSRDAAIRDCTTNTWLKGEMPQDVTWSCSCLFPGVCPRCCLFQRFLLDSLWFLTPNLP
ncbi:cystathionine gamma-lyase [Parus major]|uniref:cystathionine gamma-lyase n=1 Tax=Parus major TaxID=9157 RepID=UPI0008F4C9A3|nr:cystathionine gamma-lyase [Parus major]